MEDKTVLNTLLELKGLVGNLDGKVDGINKRLDKTNGTIARHERRINQLEDITDTTQGELKGIIVVSTILGIVIMIIKLSQYF